MMPDDPRLGKFRGDFAGRLGDIEELPDVPKGETGFAGATKIIETPDLIKRLDADPRERGDARAYLAARLVDFLINDNDRAGGDQWKWARLESGPAAPWEPIPRDRDHAFVSYDGFAARLGHLANTTVISFGGTPNVPGLTSPRDLDVRLLTELEKPVWDSVAHALQVRITNAVLDTAVRAVPSEYRASAPRIDELLKERRGALREAAEQYYRALAAHAQVVGKDVPTRATIARVNDGAVDVRLESGGTQFFARRFDVGDTKEILVYLHGGKDTAVVTGNVARSIVIRIVGGAGANRFVDSSTVARSSHPTHFYTYGPDTLLEARPSEKDEDVAPPPPENGAGLRPSVGLSDDPTVGLTPRISLARYTYGFFDRPYSSMIRVDAEYSAGFGGGRVGLTMDRRLEESPLHFTAFARVSDLEVVNFHGFGNATIDSLPTSAFVVHQRQWLFRPAAAISVGPWTDVSLGPVVQHSATDSVRSPVLAASHQYGFGNFNEAGLQFDARYDRNPPRNDSTVARNRFLLDAKAGYYPAILDVRSPFGSASLAGGMTLQLPLPTSPTLITRAGGMKLYGDFPFFEAATIGGMRTTRFMDTQRYAGDASLYGTTELLVPLAHFKFVIPVRAGITGVADAGRVYENGRSPGGWHSVTGEGIWVGRVYGSQTLSLLRTTELDHTGLQLRLGLSY